MLLGKKKVDDQEQDMSWCVVLNPLENEIDRKRVAQKISELFTISSEEASDLVRSTPIILLDHLSRSVANQLRDFFAGFGADILLSRDTLFKRKCYRTVWPQPPSLAFLHKQEVAVAEGEGETAEPLQEEVSTLRPEEVLQELRATARSRMEPIEKEAFGCVAGDSWKPAEGSIQESITEKKSEEPTRDFHPAPSSLMDRWRAALYTRDKERKEELMVPKAAAVSNSENSVSASEEEFKQQIETLEAQYASLKAEYQNVREVYEDKIMAAREDSQHAKKDLEAIQSRLQGMETEKQKMEALLKEKEQACGRLEEETRVIREGFRNDFVNLTKEIEFFRSSFQEASVKLDFLEEEKGRMEQLLLEQENRWLSVREEIKALSDKMETQLSAMNSEKVFREGNDEKWMNLEATQKELTEAFQELRSLWQSQQENWLQTFENKEQTLAARYQELSDRIERKQTAFETLLLELTQEFRTKQQGLEEKQSEWAERLQQQQAHLEPKEVDKAKKIELPDPNPLMAQMDQKIAGLCVLAEKQQQVMELILKQLLVQESRAGLQDKESRKPIPEDRKGKVAAGVRSDDHRHLTARLSDKEALLKRLVTEQEQIEKDIHDREEQMRRVIAEQEKIEKEILEVRHATRHYHLADQ